MLDGPFLHRDELPRRVRRGHDLPHRRQRQRQLWEGGTAPA
ncbi:hypothetical protein SAMN05660464_0149 [Geodermatophilus dictyosporus]|uniref:Uncharacterized protein n=1 Tax=Geodermatophilus dictyosporus TaxID=1523247 RepID=A0A1I5U8I0_9ACTN|nr:hypothetical protein SAMN05660464_0149 [Geodermatophilus dictyosporus]